MNENVEYMYMRDIKEISNSYAQASLRHSHL